VTRVLVCGGRDYDDSIHVCDVLGKLHETSPISLVIEGGARGADAYARAWAESMKVEHVTEHADWEANGRAAGPIRNQTMIEEYSPDLVIAFPGGRGTADMVTRARAHGIRVEMHERRQ
jgi:hypothetical protein